MISKALDKNKHYHLKSGRYIKSFVYGGLDGTITTFAVVAGVAGANLNLGIVLILGFANLIADGISMAVGDYLSTKAEKEYGKAERKIENTNISNFPKFGKRELFKIYLKQGFGKKDSETISKILCKNKKACVDVMLANELGIMENINNPGKNAAVTFGSFILFGFVPLLAYVLAKVLEIFSMDTFFVASVLTGLTLFLLGACKVKITKINWFKAGLEMLIVGGVAAIAAYLVGKGLAGLV